MISSYPDALKFLYDNLPMFQRLGAAAIKRDLANTLRLCAVLDDPHKRFKSIHVGGTNGKGSVSHMLASVLQTAGYRTGLYTSPHLKEFTERIKVNGKEVSQDFVVDFVNRITPAIHEIAPSFFEITVAMAFDYFAKEEVDIAVIEVGLGGRLDSTNVITPEVSVITNISWDHKDLLGDTLVAIAGEKAGIIKHGVPVVISEFQEEVADVFRLKAQEQNAPLTFASDVYRTEKNDDDSLTVFDKGGAPVLQRIDLPLKGNYQLKNVSGVVAAVDTLPSSFSVSPEAMKVGLERTLSNTGLKGRWQVLYTNPTVVCDTGHNEAGILQVLSQIATVQYHRLHIVFGVVRDKDVDAILALLPHNAFYYFCQAKIPRAMDANELARRALQIGLRGEVISDVNQAKKTAMSSAEKDDFIFIGGSTYVVAELDEL